MMIIIMNVLATIGQEDASIDYKVRPTVKVIINNNGKILILNAGYLPGGGVDEGESDEDAIRRELQEELGFAVRDVRKIGSVIQYRNFIKKRYVINGYIATYHSSDLKINPQDQGEADFKHHWLKIYDALSLVAESIDATKTKHVANDFNQGRLYNLMTTYILLKELNQIKNGH